MATMKKVFLFSVIFLLSFSQFGCTTEEDSLFGVADQKVSEEQFNHLWNTFYLHLDANNSDSAMHYAESIRTISSKEENSKWLAKSNKAIGFLLSEKGNIKEATYYYLIASKYFSEIGDLKSLADVYINLGTEYYSSQNYLSAISFYQKANEIYHYEGSYSDKGLAYRGTALCYYKLKQLEKAEEFLSLGKDAARKGNDLYNLGRNYNTWGNIKLEQKNYGKAQEFFLKALQIAEDLGGSTDLKAMTTHNMGELKFLLKNSREAEEWLKKAIAIKNELDNPILAQSSYLLLAHLLIEENKFDEAVILLEEGLQKIPPGTVDNSINESLSLITETLIALNKDADPSEYPLFNKKLITYSQKLLTYNQDVTETKEKLETISRQQAVQEAMEKHTLNEQLAEHEKRNTYMQYAFLIPVFFLICAVISVILAAKRNMEYKKLYRKIEDTLNKSKALRQLNKK